VAFGIGSLIILYPSLHVMLKVAGSLYLLWLAWKIATAAYEKLETDVPPPRPIPFYQGGLLQFLNPKAWLMALGAVESGTAIGALYVLLPPDLAPPFDVFAVGCIAAVILGVVSHAPGGLGVFEASMTAILAGRGRPDLLAALLLFRLLYNLLPFGLSVLVLGLRSGCVSRGARAPGACA